MKLQPGKLLPLTLLVALMAGCATDDKYALEAGYDEDPGAGPMAMAHVGHVAVSWAKSPGQQGLLTVARLQSAEIKKHAELAQDRAQDADWVKMHAVHIAEALDSVRQREGAGQGLIDAAKGVSLHMALAMDQDDASDAVEYHGEQVLMSIESVLMRAQQLQDVVDEVAKAPRQSDLSAQASQMATLAEQILMGVDSDEDGFITWENDEAGLNQTLKYVNFLRQKESDNSKSQ